MAALSRETTETLLFTLHGTGGEYICAFTRCGAAGSIQINYRDLISSALANRAQGLLLIHNHPSGDPTPSTDDIDGTRMLAALCRPLQLTLHDHLVLGASTLVSMRGAGLFDITPKATT